MFVSQDHFLIQCKAVAQATFIFAFSNFECSIQQSLGGKKIKKGTFGQSNCRPGLGGFLGDVWCFSKRNEVLWESEHFSTIIVLAAITPSLPQPKQGCGWQELLSPELQHDREQCWAPKDAQACSKGMEPASNHQVKLWIRLWGDSQLPALKPSTGRMAESEICFWLSRHSVSYCSTLAPN